MSYLLPLPILPSITSAIRLSPLFWCVRVFRPEFWSNVNVYVETTDEDFEPLKERVNAEALDIVLGRIRERLQ